MMLLLMYLESALIYCFCLFLFFERPFHVVQTGLKLASILLPWFASNLTSSNLRLETSPNLGPVQALPSPKRPNTAPCQNIFLNITREG